MKQIWVKADPWDKDIAIAALESGADALVLPPGRSAEAKKFGVIRTMAEDGDLKPGTDVFMVDIASKEDEQRIARLCPGQAGDGNNAGLDHHSPGESYRPAAEYFS